MYTMTFHADSKLYTYSSILKKLRIISNSMKILETDYHWTYSLLDVLMH